MKNKEKKLAIELREEGYSYSEILDYFEEHGMHVAKGTLSNWLRDVELPKSIREQIDRRANSKKGPHHK